MDIEQFIGTWRSMDFPMYHFGDGIEITLHISGNLVGTLWTLDQNRESIILAEGQISLNLLQNDNFSLVIDGIAIDEQFLELQSRMYMENNPASFLINTPKFGERYFQKLL